jgi:apolipoprotein N-acyltransferase
VYGYFNYKHTQNVEEKCPKIRVAVIQANIGNSSKLAVGPASALRKEMGVTNVTSDEFLILKKYELMTKKAVAENTNIDLIVWPETAFPGYYVERNPDMLAHKKMVAQIGIPFIFGGYYIEPSSGRYYNSAILVTRNEIDLYHKKILLPFGEFMPLGNIFPYLKTVVPTVGDFSRGAGAATLNLTINGMEVRFAPTICYEILKSDYVRKMDNKDAQVLLNLSNDSWFGTVEPYQHLRVSRMRAIEFRRPIIRSTNTGVTALIDMNGMVVKSGGINKEEIFVFDVPVCDHRIRTIYSLFGHWIPYALILVCAGLVFYVRRRNHENRP